MEKLLIYIVLLGCCSCASSTDQPFLNHFIPGEEISYTILDSNDLYVDYIPSMLKLKNKLVFSQFSGDSVFTCIDLESYKKFNFGKRGRGPREFAEGYGLEKINDTLMFLYDRSLSKLKFFSFTNDSIHYLQDHPMTPFVLDMLYANDSLYFVSNQDRQPLNYALYHKNKDSLFPFIPFPEGINNDLDNFGKSKVYYSHAVRRPNSTRFLVFKDKQPIIDAIDLKNDSLILVNRNILAHHKWKNINGVYKPENEGIPYRVFTSKIVALPGYAYALYKEKEDEYILVFDWNAKPLYSYKLPLHLLHFASDDGKTFYAVALIGEKYNLIRFELENKIPNTIEEKNYQKLPV